MGDYITIRNAGGKWVVRAGGAILGESASALELTEGSYPPVIYFPRGDIAMAMLEPSDKTSTCPHKGQARHFSISTGSGLIKDAVWSYEDPKEQVARIKDHLAFYASDDVMVEQL